LFVALSAGVHPFSGSLLCRWPRPAAAGGQTDKDCDETQARIGNGGRDGPARLRCGPAPGPAGQRRGVGQLLLLRLLLNRNSVLDTSSRNYVLDLMARVIPSQRWGVPAGAPTSLTVHVKNGWLPLFTHGWRIHSIGAFTGAAAVTASWC
jgi:hypothetical protein